MEKDIIIVRKKKDVVVTDDTNTNTLVGYIDIDGLVDTNVGIVTHIILR